MFRVLLVMWVALICAPGLHAREANRLRGADSPYLLQHQFNPVDWYPWGEEALARAKAEGKPIFVSVGYSSCHWCHVMEEESFEDDAIAAVLNAHFVAIKIDRESRPDLDEQFMAVTQILTGSAGWPNSVFLTPEGDPFHAGGYFPPDAFMSVLDRVRLAWADQPGFIRAEAARVARAVDGYLVQRADAREVTRDAVARAAGGILERLDPFNGGYGVAPKFPREPLFLFLLDQARRDGDAALLEAVTLMLDGMVRGGIHDHVGGGFHRYAVDPEWHVPHFEKMLYNQALTGRLLIRAWQITGHVRYRRAAIRLFDYVLRDMQAPAGGFYSAQDADSLTAGGERAEGAYYMWTEAEMSALGDDARFLKQVFPPAPGGDLDGSNVLDMAALPGELAAAAGLTEDAFTQRLDGLLARMHDIRHARPAPFLDRKIVVSWNGLMIATLAEAGHLLDRNDYRAAAVGAARFILDEMWAPGGLKRIWYDGRAGIDAQLPDYAALGLALVALHDFEPDRNAASRWLTGALDLAGEIRQRFGSAAEGFRMTETVDGLGPFVQIDDAEIPAGNALALHLFSRLSRRAQLPEVEQDAYRLASALSGQALKAASQRGSALTAIQDLQFGEAGPVRFAGKGAVRVAMDHDADRKTLALDLSVAEGWHINAHAPLEAYLIPTALVLDGAQVGAETYPAPVIKSLGFSDTPLALYEGDIRLTAALGPGPHHRVALTLQACSDAICLQPETLEFRLWGASGG